MASQSTKAQWTGLANYPEGPTYSATSFTIAKKAYVGGGNLSKNSFYEFDTSTDQWRYIGNIPGGVNRASAIGFSIGKKGYVGCGSDLGVGNNTSFYEFDPSNDLWTKKADFPGGFRHSGFYAAAAGKGFVIGGNNNNGNVAEVWEYNPEKDQWTQKADYPGGAVYWPAGFVIDDKIYVGTGSKDGTGLNAFYMYDPSNDTWIKKKGYPGGLRIAAVGFSLGSKGYIGAGVNIQFDKSFNDFFEYKPALDDWYPMPSLDFPTNNTAWATAFSIGNQVYVGTGAMSSTTGILQTDQFFKARIKNTVDDKGNDEAMFELYPNPTNDVVKINYELNEAAAPVITLVNANGELIEVYETGQQLPGKHQFQLPLSDIAAGSYFVNIRINTTTKSRKISITH